MSPAHHAAAFLVLRWCIGVALAMVAAWLVAAAVSRARARRDRGHFLTTTRLSIMDKEVQRACRFIETAYADRALTPTLVATQQSTGEAFLEALFSRELGMPITEFIEQVRINRAKSAFADDPAVDGAVVAPAVGIADLRQFDQLFLRITGVPVAEFRASLGQRATHA
jgi:transcriptional regulator GlxA family with amidase domain